MKIEADNVYLCETREDAEAFLQECDKQGIKWSDGIKASEMLNYDYGEDTCYHVNGGSVPYLTYDEKEDYEAGGYEITVYSHVNDEELARLDDMWKKLMQVT